ncbi:MAG: hypothetical protein ACW98J_10445 [Candidatus Thorarchaeota archaeon]
MLDIGFWDIEYLPDIFIIIIPIILIVSIIVFFRLFTLGPKMRGRFVTETPSFVISKGNRDPLRSDGNEIRTARLPNRCSNCGTLLSRSDIDWVGPLEVKCSNCGFTVMAQFEKI